MRALENIISTFSRMCSKFGDKDLFSQTFMSAGHIFTAFSNYVVASALANGYEGSLSRVENEGYRITRNDTTGNFNTF